MKSIHRDHRMNLTIEILYGGLTYKKDGIIIRQTEIDKSKSIIHGTLVSKYNGKLNFVDFDREIRGRISFIIDSENPKKAKWTLIRWVNPTSNWKETKFDIPTELGWTKIE